MIAGIPQRAPYANIRIAKPAIIRRIANITRRRNKIKKGILTAFIAHLFSIASIFSSMGFKSVNIVLSALIATSVLICSLFCLSVLPALSQKYPKQGARQITAKPIDTNIIKIGHKAKIERQVQILPGTLSAVDIAQIA